MWQFLVDKAGPMVLAAAVSIGAAYELDKRAQVEHSTRPHKDAVEEKQFEEFKDSVNLQLQEIVKRLDRLLEFHLENDNHQTKQVD
jgi:hypothetical protein